MAAQAIRAWLGALALLGLLLAALPGGQAQEQQRFGGAPIAVIGTSLLVHGLAPEGAGADSLLGDGRAWRRVGIAGGGEPELLALLDAALREGAAVVLVEVNPFVSSLAYLSPVRDCPAPGAALRVRLGEWQRALSDPLRQRFGLSTHLQGMEEPAHLDASQIVDPATIRMVYPLTIRPPCDEPRLAELVARARAAGTRVVFVLPPRSPRGDAVLGAAQVRAQRAEARGLAARLGVPLIELAGPWRDEEFVDLAHLDRTGRAHFTRDLRAALTRLAP